MGWRKRSSFIEGDQKFYQWTLPLDYIIADRQTNSFKFPRFHTDHDGFPHRLPQIMILNWLRSWQTYIWVVAAKLFMDQNDIEIEIEHFIGFCKYIATWQCPPKLTLTMPQKILAEKANGKKRTILWYEYRQACYFTIYRKEYSLVDGADLRTFLWPLQTSPYSGFRLGMMYTIPHIIKDDL